MGRRIARPFPGTSGALWDNAALMQETLERVRSIVAEHLNVPPQEIGDDVPLSQLGLDSLAALEVAFEVEEVFHISIPDSRIGEFTTLRAACEAIEGLRAGTSTA